jgi:hypothetical protein
MSPSNPLPLAGKERLIRIQFIPPPPCGEGLGVGVVFRHPCEIARQWQGETDLVHHRIGVLQHLMVPESENFVPATLQHLVACAVVSGFDRHLPPKVKPFPLQQSQALPQSAFGRRGIPSKISRKRVSDLRPPPLIPPRKEEGSFTSRRLRLGCRGDCSQHSYPWLYLPWSEHQVAHRPDQCVEPVGAVIRRSRPAA